MTRSIASSGIAADSGSDSVGVGDGLGDREHAAAEAEALLVVRVQVQRAEVDAGRDAARAQPLLQRVARDARGGFVEQHRVEMLRVHGAGIDRRGQRQRQIGERLVVARQIAARRACMTSRRASWCRPIAACRSIMLYLKPASPRRSAAMPPGA